MWHSTTQWLWTSRLRPVGLKPRDASQAIRVCLAISCLLIGSAVYIIFRPTSLLMFHWAGFLGLAPVIAAARSLWSAGATQPPGWLVYSLPFALWVASYLFLVRAIWRRSQSLSRHVWFWCIPLASVASELLQGAHVIPGTFDPVDMLVIVVATLCVLVVEESIKSEEGQS